MERGSKCTEEHKQKVSIALKGRKKPPRTNKHKQNISQSRKGMVFSDEHKKKLSLSHEGEKNPSWCGGTSCSVYAIDWTETLRRSIRERDYYVCRLCGNPQGDRVLCVHHIDYNKKNCSPHNLISLCCSCHSKTNGNRKKYIALLQDLIK